MNNGVFNVFSVEKKINELRLHEPFYLYKGRGLARERGFLMIVIEFENCWGVKEN